jgi:hypothetical protein
MWLCALTHPRRMKAGNFYGLVPTPPFPYTHLVDGGQGASHPAQLLNNAIVRVGQVAANDARKRGHTTEEPAQHQPKVVGSDAEAAADFHHLRGGGGGARHRGRGDKERGRASVCMVHGEGVGCGGGEGG